MHFLQVFSVGTLLCRYTVHAEGLPSGSVTDDHGDSHDAATSLFGLHGERPEARMRGTIEASGARDFFRFHTRGLQYIEIRTTGGARVRGTLWRSEADGQAQLERYRYGRLGRNFRMKTRIPGGTYFVEVAGAGGTTGGYTLSIRGAYAASRVGPRLAEGLDSGREIEIGSVFDDCPDCPLMAVIPGGRFRMGRPLTEPKGRFLPESYDLPMTEVRIGGSNQVPLAIGVYEVTYGEWLACREDGACRSGGHGHTGGHDYPASRVNFEDMQEYVHWLSRKTGEIYRLPTEAEWEYAARAGTQTQFGFGDRINSAWARYHSNGTVLVGTYEPNRFGLHDMHGNLREATEDCRNDLLEGVRRNGWSRLTGNCSRRVVRGGSYPLDATILRSGSRHWWQAGVRHTGTGFRVVRELRIQ
ncbi:MAG: formylglycine-generating enzyme family protein [Bryobacterales bacterium]|nr:formylglycine-generating enzyme family protein [Bryobacterales bacterium]